MRNSTFEGVADGPVIALAQLRLQRAKLSLPCTTRAQAITILRSIRPAPSKRQPLNIKPCNPTAASICRKCGKPIAFGQACRTYAMANDGDEHITCPKDLETLFARSITQIETGN